MTDSEKIELLQKIDMFKLQGYDVINGHLSFTDSYEEIKYSYELNRHIIEEKIIKDKYNEIKFVWNLITNNKDH